MSNFLFHKVSEKEKAEIQKSAKQIMDSFSKKLSKIRQNIPEPKIKRKEFERQENSEKTPEIDKKIMFGNAPKTKGDFIVAEKGGWE